MSPGYQNLPEASPASTAPTSQPRVLVIDDDVVDRTAVVQILSEEFLVSAACSLTDALAACERQDFDCAILDYQLSDSQGVRGLETLASYEVPVIVLTGRAERELAIDALKAGAYDYLLKEELQRELLVRSVRHALQRARLEEKLLRQQAETKASREQLFRFLENMPVGVLVVDVQGRPLFVNREAERIFPPVDARDLTDLETLNRVFPTFSPGTGEVVPFARLPLVRAMRGETVHNETVEVRLTDTKIFLEVSAAPLLDGHGKAEFAICSLRDVTVRWNLQQQLRSAQRMEAVGRLAGGVAHDFNNLLTAIISFAKFAASAVSKESSVHEDLMEVLHAARRAEDLTQQLLSFSRRRPVNPRLVDPNRKLRNLERMLQRVVGEDVAVVLELGSLDGAVQIDPGALEQVVMNLAINARDAMPSGGRICLSTRQRYLNAAEAARLDDTAKPGPYLVIAVSDTGQGIAPEAREHIFEPFFSTKGPDKGTGLGLATCYGIIKQAGGFIDVGNQTSGAVFEVHLPRAQGAAPGSMVPPSYDRRHLGSERVLIVEDNDQVREATRRILSRLGYQVTALADPEDAIEWAAGGQVAELLLTDVIMPKMNGIQLAHRLGATWPELKVAFMTGYAEDALVHGGAVPSGVALLQKPFAEAKAAELIRQVLDEAGHLASSLPD